MLVHLTNLTISICLGENVSSEKEGVETKDSDCPVNNEAENKQYCAGYGNHSFSICYVQIVN